MDEGNSLKPISESLKISIPKNSLGDDDLLAVKEKFAKSYGFSELKNWQAEEIAAAEAELGECEGCTGLCKKTVAPYSIPVIRNLGGELDIAHTSCKWGEILRLRGKFKYSQVPAKYADKTFDDYDVTDDNEQAVKGAKWFIKESLPAKGLFLYGETGTGKTFLAALIAKEYVLSLKSVVFGDVPALLDELKATFDHGGTDEVLNKYCDCDLLILDDIGAGRLTDWSVGVLYRIINSRYNAGKSLVVTCNYNLDGLEEILTDEDAFAGRRVVSRLREMTYKIHLGGNDRRK